MFKKLVVALIALAVAFGGSTFALAATPKSGASCSPKGKVLVIGTKKYTCIKSGSKLVWSSPVTVKASKPSQSATPTPIDTPANDTALALAKPLDTCKLQETANQTGAGAKGFPGRRTVSSLGKVKVAILPVDFANAVGQGNPESLYRDDVSKIEQWGQFFSRGKMSYEVEFKASSWLRAPKGADWYTCLECQKGAKEQKQSQQEALQQLVDVADASYDFASTNLLYFVFPFAAEKNFGTALYSHRSTLQTKEGPITVAAYGEMGGGVGAVADRTTIWDHAIHEFLHFQGFIGHGPENGSEYYISTNQWGASQKSSYSAVTVRGSAPSIPRITSITSDVPNELIVYFSAPSEADSVEITLDCDSIGNKVFSNIKKLSKRIRSDDVFALVIDNLCYLII